MEATELDLSILALANRCEEHKIAAFAGGDVVKVIASREWCHCEKRGWTHCDTYCGHYGAAVYRLHDGRFAAVTESEDTSGHGCVCSGTGAVYDTLPDALRLGLSEEEAAMLGLADRRAAAIAAVTP